MTRFGASIACVAVGIALTAYVWSFASGSRVRRELREVIVAADADCNAGRAADAISKYTRALNIIERLDSSSLVDTGNGLEATDSVRSRVLYERGRCNGRVNDFDGAMRDLERARMISPERVDIPIEIGIALMRQHRWNEAVSAFSDALVIDPNAGRAYSNRGATRRFAGDLVGARQDLVKAIALEVGAERAHYNLGIIEEVEGHDDRAVAEYDAAIAAGCPVADCRERRDRLATRGAAAVATKRR